MRSIESEPRKEKLYQGIQGIEISSVGWLLQEKELYQMVNELNKNRSKDDQIGIELFPHRLVTCQPKIVGLWEKENRLAKTKRIHLPVTYDSKDYSQALQGCNLKEKATSVIFLGLFGVAKNSKAIEMAKIYGLEVNLHPSSLSALFQEGKLDDLKKNTAGVFTEHTAPYNSPWVKDQRMIFDPFILKDYIKEYQIRGLTIDTDHLKKRWFGKTQGYENGFEPVKTIKENEDVTGRIHLSGQEKEHGLFPKDDPFFNSFIKEVSQMSFNQPLKIVFEFDPRALFSWKSSKKLEFFRSLIEVIDSYRYGKKN